MKLTIINEALMFDYSAIDIKAKDQKTYSFRAFCAETAGIWQKAERKLLKAQFDVNQYKNNPTAYDIAHDKLMFYTTVYTRARQTEEIEISDNVKQYIDRLGEECRALKEAEIAEKREREAQKRWESLCENGCGRCSNKVRWNDDFKCKASGDYLPEKNIPKYMYGIYMLFNYEAFPTENCPYKKDKKQGD